MKMNQRKIGQGCYKSIPKRTEEVRRCSKCGEPMMFIVSHRCTPVQKIKTVQGNVNS